MVQEQERPQRPGLEPETRELEPMQRPDDMPQLPDEERQLGQQEPAPTPREWNEPRPGGDASPPIGSEVEPTTDEPASAPHLTDKDIAEAP